MKKDVEKILQERAERLSHSKGQIGLFFNELNSMVFLLDNEKYALELSYIREVTLIKEWSPLPCVPRFVVGLMNLRRQILPIFDLRIFFDLPAPKISHENRVIILENEGSPFALLTDGILEVSSIDLSQLMPPLPTLTGVRQEFLKGISADGVLLLDGDRLMTSPRLIIDDDMDK